MSKSLKSWFVWVGMACATMFSVSQVVSAQTDCGCNQVSQGYSLDNHGQSPCGSGCGSGSFMGRLRNALSCDSKFRPGLWDGYCDERSACQTGNSGLRGHGVLGDGLMGHGLMGHGLGGHDCGTGAGGGEVAASSDCGGASDCGTGDCGNGGCNIFGSRRVKTCGLLSNLGKRHGGLRLFHFPQAAGCGSGAYGLPSDCGCAAPAELVATTANAGVSGCGNGDCDGGCNSGGCSIFGIKHNCFRNDGHFFGCLSRHGHRHSLLAHREGGRCNLFGGMKLKSFGFGSLGCGHCQNGSSMDSYAVGCGSDATQPKTTPAETTPAETTSAAPVNQ
jgi:hypothetical protein